MIFAPPQHGKSELVSVRLSAFWLAKNPDLPVILSSYAASLAESKSEQARDLVESEQYQRLFPEIRINRTSRKVEFWRLLGYKGYMKSAGVGGPITGHGAGLGIIDDPFENWDRAQSQVYRKHVWDWYRTTFRTRIWEGGSIVLIMTRWHKGDLAGLLLEDQGEEWEVLRLPAISESQEERDKNNQYLGLPVGEPDPLGRKEGEPLCPQRFSLNALLSLKKDVGSMGWSAEYQGVPRATEGNRFREEWFKVINEAPAVVIDRAPMVRYWDNAATQDGGCYTAGVLMAVWEHTIYIMDVVHGQWSSENRDAVMLSTAKTDAAAYQNRVEVHFEKEGGSSGVDAATAIVKLLAGHPVYADRVSGSKDVRLMPFESQAEAGNVRLVARPGAKWVRTYIDEFLEIPNGVYRDQSDATSGAYNLLALRDDNVETGSSPIAGYRG